MDIKMGLLGEYFKLKVKFIDEKEQQKQFFIKTIASGESQKRFILENGAIRKEEVFYSKFIPMCIENGAVIIKECTVNCHLVRQMFIFDDLSVENYRVLNVKNCASLRHIELTLKCLAKFHGSSYILEESLTKKSGKIYRICDNFNTVLNEALYSDTSPSKQLMESLKSGVRTHIELFKDHLNNKDMTTLTSNVCNIVDNYSNYLKSSVKYRNVLCHGDLWAANIMYKHEENTPVDVKLVDFQTYRYCPPTMDVVTFLYFHTNRKFRKEHFDSFIHLYFNELSEILRTHNLNLEVIFPKSDFMESLEYYKNFAICQASTHGQLTMMDTNLLSDILCDSNAVDEIMCRNRRAVMLKVFEKDDTYKQKLYELFEDLIDISLLPNNLPRIVDGN